MNTDDKPMTATQINDQREATSGADLRWRDTLENLKVRLRSSLRPSTPLTADDIRQRLALKPLEQYRNGEGDTIAKICQALAYAANGLTVAWATRDHGRAVGAFSEVHRLGKEADLPVEMAKRGLIKFTGGGEIFFLSAGQHIAGVRLDRIIED